MTDHTHGFKVGDIVTTYNKGFFEVTDIEKRWGDPNTHEPMGENEKGSEELNDLVHYRMLLTKDLKPRKSKREQTCCVTYCAHVDDWIQEKHEELFRLERSIAEIRSAKESD